jgi:hypothetical protein
VFDYINPKERKIMVFAKHLSSELEMARSGHKPLEDVFYELSQSQATWHHVSMDRAMEAGFNKSQAMIITILNSIKNEPKSDLVSVFTDMAIPSELELFSMIESNKAGHGELAREM